MKILSKIKNRRLRAKPISDKANSRRVLVTAVGSMSAPDVIVSLKNCGYEVYGTDIYPPEWIGGKHLLKHISPIPLAFSPDYISALLKECQINDIRYLLPLTDPEIDAILPYRDRFIAQGTIPCIANEHCLKLCRDKRRFFELFRDDNHIHCIPTYIYAEIDDITFPAQIIAKRKNGRSSEGQYVLNNKKEVVIIKEPTDYIFQPYLSGDIYCVDFVRDDRNNFAAVARRELLRTKNGAGTSVITVYDEKLLDISRHIAQAIDAFGCMNLEFIYHRDEFYLMDINPRFSAGVGFSFAAGYDMVANHLRCFTKEPLDSPLIYPETVFCKRWTLFSAINARRGK